MKEPWFLLCLILGASASCSQGDDRPASQAPSTPEQDVMNLEAYMWKKRVLLAFAPEDNEALRRHREAWTSVSAEVQERDMVRLEVVGDEVFDGGRRGAADGLRARFRPEKRELVVVLVGKDGGEKMRGADLSPPDVFRTIDAMPMRRREMREREGVADPVQ